MWLLGLDDLLPKQLEDMNILWNLRQEMNIIMPIYVITFRTDTADLF